MPWFRVDDDLPFHHKVVQAGNPAMGLWVRAGAWSAKYLTEGFIPADVARSMGTRTQIDRLVTAGLWCITDDGYEIHEYLDRNPTREKVLAERASAKERQARARGKATMKRVTEMQAKP